MLILVLVRVLVLKDSLRTFSSPCPGPWGSGPCPYPCPWGVRSRRSLSLSWSLGVRSLSLSWSLGLRSLSLSWSLGVRSLLTSLLSPQGKVKLQALPSTKTLSLTTDLLYTDPIIMGYIGRALWVQPRHESIPVITAFKV